MSRLTASCILAIFRVASVLNRLSYKILEWICDFADTVLQGYLSRINFAISSDSRRTGVHSVKSKALKRSTANMTIASSERKLSKVRRPNKKPKSNTLKVSSKRKVSMKLDNGSSTVLIPLSDSNQVVTCDLRQARKVVLSYEFSGCIKDDRSSTGDYKESISIDDASEADINPVQSQSVQLHQSGNLNPETALHILPGVSLSNAGKRTAARESVIKSTSTERNVDCALGKAKGRLQSDQSCNLKPETELDVSSDATIINTGEINVIEIEMATTDSLDDVDDPFSKDDSEANEPMGSGLVLQSDQSCNIEPEAELHILPGATILDASSTAASECEIKIIATASPKKVIDASSKSAPKANEHLLSCASDLLGAKISILSSDLSKSKEYLANSSLIGNDLDVCPTTEVSETCASEDMSFETHPIDPIFKSDKDSIAEITCKETSNKAYKADAIVESIQVSEKGLVATSCISSQKYMASETYKTSDQISEKDSKDEHQTDISKTELSNIHIKSTSSEPPRGGSTETASFTKVKENSDNELEISNKSVCGTGFSRKNKKFKNSRGKINRKLEIKSAGTIHTLPKSEANVPYHSDVKESARKDVSEETECKMDIYLSEESESKTDTKQNEKETESSKRAKSKSTSEDTESKTESKIESEETEFESECKRPTEETESEVVSQYPSEETQSKATIQYPYEETESTTETKYSSKGNEIGMKSKHLPEDIESEMESKNLSDETESKLECKYSTETVSEMERKYSSEGSESKSENKPSEGQECKTESKHASADKAESKYSSEDESKTENKLSSDDESKKHSSEDSKSKMESENPSEEIESRTRKEHLPQGIESKTNIEHPSEEIESVTEELESEKDNRKVKAGRLLKQIASEKQNEHLLDETESKSENMRLSAATGPEMENERLIQKKEIENIEKLAAENEKSIEELKNKMKSKDEKLAILQETCINLVRSIIESVEGTKVSLGSLFKDPVEKPRGCDTDTSGPSKEYYFSENFEMLNDLMQSFKKLKHTFPPAAIVDLNKLQKICLENDIPIEASQTRFQKFKLETDAKLRTARKQFDEKDKVDGDILMKWINRRKIELKRHSFEATCVLSHDESSSEPKVDAARLKNSKVMKRNKRKNSKRLKSEKRDKNEEKMTEDTSEAKESDFPRYPENPNRSFLCEENENIITPNFNYYRNTAESARCDLSRHSVNADYCKDIENSLFDFSIDRTKDSDIAHDSSHYDVLENNGRIVALPVESPDCKSDKAHFKKPLDRRESNLPVVRFNLDSESKDVEMETNASSSNVPNSEAEQDVRLNLLIIQSADACSATEDSSKTISEIKRPFSSPETSSQNEAGKNATGANLTEGLQDWALAMPEVKKAIMQDCAGKDSILRQGKTMEVVVKLDRKPAPQDEECEIIEPERDCIQSSAESASEDTYKRRDGSKQMRKTYAEAVIDPDTPESKENVKIEVCGKRGGSRKEVLKKYGELKLKQVSKDSAHQRKGLKKDRVEIFQIIPSPRFDKTQENMKHDTQRRTKNASGTNEEIQDSDASKTSVIVKSTEEDKKGAKNKSASTVKESVSIDKSVQHGTQKKTKSDSGTNEETPLDSVASKVGVIVKSTEVDKKGVDNKSAMVKQRESIDKVIEHGTQKKAKSASGTNEESLDSGAPKAYVIVKSPKVDKKGVENKSACMEKESESIVKAMKHGAQKNTKSASGTNEETPLVSDASKAGVIVKPTEVDKKGVENKSTMVKHSESIDKAMKHGTQKKTESASGTIEETSLDSDASKASVIVKSTEADKKDVENNSAMVKHSEFMDTSMKHGPQKKMKSASGTNEETSVDSGVLKAGVIVKSPEVDKKGVENKSACMEKESESIVKAMKHGAQKNTKSASGTNEETPLDSKTNAGAIVKSTEVDKKDVDKNSAMVKQSESIDKAMKHGTQKKNASGTNEETPLVSDESKAGVIVKSTEVDKKGVENKSMVKYSESIDKAMKHGTQKKTKSASGSNEETSLDSAASKAGVIVKSTEVDKKGAENKSTSTVKESESIDKSMKHGTPKNTKSASGTNDETPLGSDASKANVILKPTEVDKKGVENKSIVKQSESIDKAMKHGIQKNTKSASGANEETPLDSDALKASLIAKSTEADKKFVGIKAGCTVKESEPIEKEDSSAAQRGRYPEEGTIVLEKQPSEIVETLLEISANPPPCDVVILKNAGGTQDVGTQLAQPPMATESEDANSLALLLEQAKTSLRHGVSALVVAQSRCLSDVVKSTDASCSDSTSGATKPAEPKKVPAKKRKTSNRWRFP